MYRRRATILPFIVGIINVACAGCSEGTARFHIVTTYERLSRIPRGSSLIEVQKAAGDQGIFQYRFQDDEGAERLGVGFRLRNQFNQVVYHFADDRLVRVTRRIDGLTRPYQNRLGYWSRQSVPEAPRRRAERMLSSTDLREGEVVEIARKYQGPRFVAPLVFAAGLVFLIDPIGVIAHEAENDRFYEQTELEEARRFADFERRYDPFKFKLGMPRDLIESLFGAPLSHHEIVDGRQILIYGVSKAHPPKLHVIFKNGFIGEVYGGDFRTDALIKGESDL